MPTKSFALEPDGPKRLTASWQEEYQDFRLSLDRRDILHFSASSQLKAGRSTTLPDGRELKAQLVRVFMAWELRLDLDGKPVPGSDGEPRTRLWGAIGTIYLVAGLGLALGLVAQIFSIRVLQNAGLGWSSCLAGLVLAGLGYWLQRSPSYVALALAVGLFALDSLSGGLYFLTQPGHTPNVGLLAPKIFLLIGMARGFGALHDLEAQKQSASDGIHP